MQSCLKRVSAVQTTPNVFYKPVDVAETLNDLGLSNEILWESLAFGVSYAAECTSHDPANLAGILIWGKATRMLRDQLVPRGWTKQNTQNYPTTVHSSGAWAIAVAGGDSRTGLPDKTPATRSEKGPVTREVIDQNQLSFAGISAEFARPRRQTWLLLHNVDEVSGELRAELSLPAEMTDDGYVVEWQVRIILEPPSKSLLGQPDANAGAGPNDQDVIDVPVRKRA